MSLLTECDVISVRKMDGDGSIKAFADVRIGGGLVIRGCSVVDGKNGTFVSMPRKVGRDGQWRDVVVAVDDELKTHYSERILQAYTEA